MIGETVTSGPIPAALLERQQIAPYQERPAQVQPHPRLYVIAGAASRSKLRCTQTLLAGHSARLTNSATEFEPVCSMQGGSDGANVVNDDAGVLAGLSHNTLLAGRSSGQAPTANRLLHNVPSDCSGRTALSLLFKLNLQLESRRHEASKVMRQRQQGVASPQTHSSRSVLPSLQRG